MKTKFTLVLTVAVVALVLASCGSGRTASCDAYGSVNSTANTDIAQK
jgi:outer membrane lipoprotein SlyB